MIGKAKASSPSMRLARPTPQTAETASDPTASNCQWMAPNQIEIHSGKILSWRNKEISPSAKGPKSSEKMPDAHQIAAQYAIVIAISRR